MLWFIFIIFVIALPFGIIGAIAQGASDTQIIDVHMCETVGNKVVFEIYYKNGRSRVETVKAGTSRYNQLRGWCR